MQQNSDEKIWIYMICGEMKYEKNAKRQV